MQRPIRTYGARAAFLLLLLSWGGVSAEQIQHHGVTADTDGSLPECISCHDGSLAHSASFCTVKCDFKSPHSVLKAYPPKGKEASFAPVSVLKAKGIKLVNGRVTCISCHNLINQDQNHLVVDNRGSKLCLICHVKV